MKLETINFCGFSPHGSVIFLGSVERPGRRNREAGVGLGLQPGRQGRKTTARGVASKMVLGVMTMRIRAKEEGGE